MPTSIWQLSYITIRFGGKSAWFGGSTLKGPVVQYLWDKGFVATACEYECVGMVRASLGGGHSGGSIIRVNATSYSDLYWGIIITSYEMNILPRGAGLWHYHNYIWRGNKLELVFNALNQLHGNDTILINKAYNVGNFSINATMSSEEPVLFWTLAYRGTTENAEKILNAIEAAYQQVDDVPHTQIAQAQGHGMSDSICQHGSVHSTSTVFLQVYNLTAERLICESFKRRAAQDADLTAGTSIMHEAYSMEAVGPAASASSFNADRLLMLFNAVVLHPDSEKGP
ncbi:hypothetical protein JMJ35_010457 [Cladonia borealis]|uniref:Uncharacterized protein n=1 Tax=Cladonia borealis TaxID=184061 RepID=A0AA39V1K6_9LECA|nr:hypothetical protein JMJ35_010457 [Cladonia borealis]